MTTSISTVSEYGHRWEGWSIEGAGRIRHMRFCPDDQIRIRTIVKRARRRPTGKHSSWKNDRHMQWESPNEKHAFTHLDFRYDILAYREQACEIVFIDDEGQEVAHYPDVDVLAITGHEIWEVKPERYANSRLVSRRTEIISEALVTFGITYRMAVAEELRMQPRLKTMDKVLGFGNRPVSNAERASVARELIQSGRLTWGDACSGRFGSNGREILCRLVLEGFLQIDVDCLFGTATEFVTGNRSW